VDYSAYTNTSTNTHPKNMQELKPKQERFCQKYIEYGDATRAYREVYDCEGKSMNALYVEACRLRKEEHIALRIEEIKKMHFEEHKITVSDLLNELEEARQVALNGEKQQPAAAVSATMGKAKLLGLDKQIIDITTNGESVNKPTLIELVAPNIDK
jgi:phage terminase small subunit